MPFFSSQVSRRKASSGFLTCNRWRCPGEKIAKPIGNHPRVPAVLKYHAARETTPDPRFSRVRWPPGDACPVVCRTPQWRNHLSNRKKRLSKKTKGHRYGVPPGEQKSCGFPPISCILLLTPGAVSISQVSRRKFLQRMTGSAGGCPRRFRKPLLIIQSDRAIRIHAGLHRRLGCSARVAAGHGEQRHDCLAWDATSAFTPRQNGSCSPNLAAGVASSFRDVNRYARACGDFQPSSPPLVTHTRVEKSKKTASELNLLLQSVQLCLR